jgi:hypothetical protein
MILDKKGKLFGKVSIVDMVIILAVAALLAGYLLRSVSDETQRIVNSDTTFYVTFVVEKIRDYAIDAVSEGDVYYQQNVGAALGTVTAVRVEPTGDIVKRNDGTAVYMTMEDKYNLYITLECKGNITESGYYINGNNHVAAGGDIKIKSNMLSCSAKVYEISE